MTIPNLSPTPVRGDPDTFSAAFETLLSGLDPWAVAVQAVGDAADADATAAAASAATATTQAGLATTNGAAQVALATTQATNAADSATASANSALVAGAIAWVSGTSYTTGNVRYSPINFQAYRRTTDGAGTTDPSADSTNWARALAVGVNSVTTATGMTTLTSTPTLLKITPASYGVAVTLPDATTCSVGGPLHIIDNKGAYPVRVLNSAGTLLGFIFAGVVSHVSLSDNSTAAGVWTVENSELVGASAQLLTTTITTVTACIDLGSSRELIIGGDTPYAVVYNRSTNTFGTPVLVRNVSVITKQLAGLVAADTVLFVSCSSTTALEAVVLSISGNAITVNTAATATLAANINNFSIDAGLVVVGSSYIFGYNIVGVFYELRALTISGTTVTIGTAVRQSSQDNSTTIQLKLSYLGSGSVVLAASGSNAGAGGTGYMYVTPYTVSGSSLSVGTQVAFTTGAANQSVVDKFVLLGSGRWYISFSVSNGGTNYDGIVSLSSTTATMTTVSRGASGIADAIIVSSTKVLVLNNSTGNNANILTDSAGTASAGTAISFTNTASGRVCLYVSGTDVAVQDGTTTYHARMLNCSGASPVLTKTLTTGGSNVEANEFSVSNAVLSRSPKAVYGTAYARHVWTEVVTANFDAEVRGGVFRRAVHNNVPGDTETPGAAYRGKSASEIWIADASTVITKVECVQ